ncbi:hypothetical protein ACFE04_004981 [Oxalis oulophora]
MDISDVPFGDLRHRTCVVLGGRGFLGKSLVFRLLKLGHWIVRVADSAHSFQLDTSDDRDSVLSQAVNDGRAFYRHVDVRDKSQIVKVVEGSSVVFYMEATDLDPDDFYNSYMVIVQGAKNVIIACQESRVRRLIYNSTADIVFDGSKDIVNGDETLSCNWKFQDTLTDLRAQAEALVLFANNIDGLLTCALRPSNIFGPGYSQFVPSLVHLAKSGWAKGFAFQFIIGSGENVADFTYVENVCHSHICAAEALESRMVFVAGKAFFITNLEPVKFWEFVSLLLEGLGYQRPLIKVPSKMVLYILVTLTRMCEKLCIRIPKCSFSVHYFVRLTSRTRTFDCTLAQKHLGYSPLVSLEEGIKSTVESFNHLAKDSFTRCREFPEQSKMDKLLGGGKVADILLWRDEKETFVNFLALAVLFYCFFLSGRTFASSASMLLLLVTLVLFGYGFLPSQIYGFTVPEMSSSYFEISEVEIRGSFRRVVHLWNRGFRSIKSMAKGEDWNNFFKVAVFLYFLKKILAQSLTTVVGVALVFSFTAFFVYEQYETEIDRLAVLLLNKIKGSGQLLMRNLPAPAKSLLQDYGVLNQHMTPKT